MIITTICFKCGTDKNIIKHHLSYENDIVVDCCRSCHKYIHNKIRRDGRCRFTADEVSLLSNSSSHKRYYNLHKKQYKNYRENNKEKHKLYARNYDSEHIGRLDFYDGIGKNVGFFETIRYNQKTGNVGYSCWFSGSHDKKLFAIEEKEGIAVEVFK